MAGLRPLLVGLLLSGLFAFALITGGIMLGTNNNSQNNIGNDPALASYKTNLESTLGEAQANANASVEAIGESPISVIPGAFVFDAIAGVWKTLKVVPVTIYNLTFGLLKAKVFGATFDVVFGITAAILIILIIFGVIKMVSSGQDE